jgi:hypothetical protein
MTSGDEEKSATANPSPHDGQPADVIKEDVEIKSAVPPRGEKGGEIQVSVQASEKITIYYDAAIIARRREIFQLNEDSFSIERTDDE